MAGPSAGWFLLPFFGACPRKGPHSFLILRKFRRGPLISDTAFVQDVGPVSAFDGRTHVLLGHQHRRAFLASCHDNVKNRP